MEGLSLLDKITLAFNPDQERDAGGKWTSGGGDSVSDSISRGDLVESYRQQKHDSDATLDWGHADWSGFDFSGLTLEKVSFEKSNMTGANFEGARLIDCDFDKCTITDTVFKNAIFEEGTSFSQTKGENPDFASATFPDNSKFFDKAELFAPVFTDALVPPSINRYGLIDAVDLEQTSSFGKFLPSFELPSAEERAVRWGDTRKEIISSLREEFPTVSIANRGSLSENQLSLAAEGFSQASKLMPNAIESVDSITFAPGSAHGGKTEVGANGFNIKIYDGGAASDYAASDRVVINGVVDSDRAIFGTVVHESAHAAIIVSNVIEQAPYAKDGKVAVGSLSWPKDVFQPVSEYAKKSPAEAAAEGLSYSLTRQSNDFPDPNQQASANVIEKLRNGTTVSISNDTIATNPAESAFARTKYLTLDGDNKSKSLTSSAAKQNENLESIVFVTDYVPNSWIWDFIYGTNNLTAAFNPHQERDENGKWTSGGAEPKTGKVDISEIKIGADLSGRDLSGMDLSGVDLFSADLYGANLTDANLTGANLSYANLTRAILNGANLTDANLLQAGLQGAYLDSAVLTNANLNSAILHEADLTGANLSNADLTGAHSTGAALPHANLSGANLSRAYLQDADLTGTNLTGADLMGVSLYHANLSGADMSGANLRNANLSGADMSGADLTGADLSNANLRAANLINADLTGADLTDADLSIATLRGATIPQLELSNKENNERLEVAKESAQFPPNPTLGSFSTHELSFDKLMQAINDENELTGTLGQTYLKGAGRFTEGADPEALKKSVEDQIRESADFSAFSGIDKDSLRTPRSYTDAWQNSSNSTSEAEMIQESASRVLLNQEADLPEGWDNNYNGTSAQAELVVFEMYQRTQKELADVGYKPDDTVTLFRGIRNADGLSLRPLSSWSLQPSVAQNFSGATGLVFVADVQVANIVSLPTTGFGCYDESEVIVLSKGADNLTAAFNPDQERDEDGKWTSSGSEPKTSKVDISEIVPNADLRGRDLRDMNLTGMDLTGVNLNGANLLGAQVIGADLSGTNLLGANLSLTDLTGAHFTGADLTGAMMLNATLTDTDLTGANLTKVDFQYSELKNVDFTDANLTDANFQYSELKNVDFTDAIVTGADFTGVNLNKVTMSSEQRLEIKQEIEDLKTADGRAVKEVVSAIKEELGKKDANMKYEEYTDDDYEAKIYTKDDKLMGNMSFSVNDGTLSIGIVQISDQYQGEGTATVIQQAIINEALDPQNGIDFVAFHANIAHGGYAWADTSYPTQGSWGTVQGFVGEQIKEMKETDEGKKIDFSNVEKALASDDPRSIQIIHDDKTLLPDSLVSKSTKGNELGRELLLDSDWYAIMPTSPENLANAQRRLAASGATDKSSWMPDVPEKDLSKWLPWPCYVREDGSVTDDGIWEDFSDAKRTKDFSYWPVTLAFNPDQERDENGRWTSNGETTNKEAEKIVKAVLQNEGYSVKPLTGEVPMSGYMVAVPNTSHVVSSEDFFNKQNTDKVADSLDDFMEKHEAAFDDGAWLGLWYSKETSEIVYDVVDQIENREEAVAQGIARDQISIYDVVNGVEIQTGGTGGLTASGQARSFHNPTGQKMVGNDFGRKTNMDSFGSRAFRGGSKQTLAFNPDQPRDADGKWTSGGAEPKTGKVDPSEIVPNADLSGRDLLGMDLSGRDLSGINFTGARLFRANLEGANLTDANLTDANLRHADLTAANLTNANFTDANLTESNLNEADLINTNLTNADLTGAIVIKADLTDADLTGANLTDTIGMSPSMQYANSKNELLLAEAKATINTDGIKDFDTRIIYEESPVGSDDVVTPPPKEGSPEWRLWENQLDRSPIDLKMEVEDQIAASAVFSTSHQTNESLLTPREYADTWADNSNDNRESEAIQESASRVLLNQEAPLPEGWEDHYKGQSDQVELVMLKMYERTQSYLSDQGYKEDDTLTLYRGVQMEFGDRPPSWEVDTPLQLRPLSSWSTEFEVARGFLKDNGYILEAEVPITNIVSLPMTGLGCLDEKEVVVGRPNSQSTLDNLTAAFDPNQERDKNGRWTSSGGTDTETFLGRDGSEKIANIADPDMAQYARTNADLIRENTPQSSYEGADSLAPSDEVFKRNDSGLQQIASLTWAATFQQCEDITIAADNLLGFATQDREWSDDVQFGDGSIDTNAPVYAQEMLDALTEDSPNNESYESALFNIKENWNAYGLEKVLVGENTDLPYAMRGINNNTGFMDSLDLAFQEKENVGWSLASFVPAGDFAARMRSEISEGMNDEQSAISIAKGFQSPMVSDTEPERVGLIHLTNGSALAVSTDSFEIVTGGEFKIVDRLTGPQATDYLENLAKTAADYGDDIGYSDQTVYVMEQVALPDYERGD